MNRRAAPSGWCLAATALLTLASFVISGCPIGPVGRLSYISPSINAPNARYTYPSAASASWSRAPTYASSPDGRLPTGVQFDVGGVNVLVDADPPMCDRLVGAYILLFIAPIPVPYRARGDSPSLRTLVTIKGDGVSVDPARVLLRDPTGREVHGTFIFGSPPTLEFKTTCDSDSYDLILNGVTVDGRAVEMPTVHFARGSVGSVSLCFPSRVGLCGG
jgi:hypothetical protein